MPEESMTERAAAVQSVRVATAGASEAVQLAAMEALIPPPGRATANRLWRDLVRGLVVLVGVALAGLIYVVADGKPATGPDTIVTAFTALLTGLLGLFVKSPVQKG